MTTITNSPPIPINISPQNSVSKPPPKPQNKTKPETTLLYKDFFESKASNSKSFLAQRLAACVLKMSPNQTTETKEEFLTTLKDTLTNYDKMTEDLEELHIEINKLRDENLLLNQKKNDQIPMDFQIPNFLENFFDKEFFPEKAYSSTEKIQSLASCLLEKPFTPEIQNKFLISLRHIILDYEKMNENLQNLSREISVLKQDKINPYMAYMPTFIIENEELVLSPKKPRKQLLKLLQELVDEATEFYDKLESQQQTLLNEKRDLSASMCLSTKKKWDKQNETLSKQKELLKRQEEATLTHLSIMKKEIEEIEKNLTSKALAVEDQNLNKEVLKTKMPTIAKQNLTYLDTKRLRDSLTFYYNMAHYQIKAAEWKLTYICLIDTAFAEITELAIEIGQFRAEVDDLKTQLQKQAVKVENTLKSVIVTKYNELAERTKKNYLRIKDLKNPLENKDNMFFKEKDIFVYDNQTKLIMFQEIEKIQSLMQSEQKQAYDKIKTVWETVEEGMGLDSKIPGLKERWLLGSTKKSLTYEINRLYTAAKEKYTSLPLDSTEGRLWTLQKIVYSPFGS